MKISEQYPFPLNDTSYPLYADLDFTPIYDKEAPNEVDKEQFNCTMSMVLEFPPDLFSDEERLHRGAVVFHFIATFYAFMGFTIVCDKYFFPSIQQLSQGLNIKSDVAGATLLSWVTSSPELFTNIIGIFIMKGDMGVGTIIGSAPFNHLAILAAIGLASPTPVKVEAFGVNRDVAFYGMAVIALLVVLWDETIFWYECICLVALYGIYIMTMVYDTSLRAFFSLHPPSFILYCFSNSKRSYNLKDDLTFIDTLANNNTTSRSLSVLSKSKTVSQVTLLSLVTPSAFFISEENPSSNFRRGKQQKVVRNSCLSGDKLKLRLIRTKALLWVGVSWFVRGASVPLKWLFSWTIPTLSKSSSVLRVLLTFLLSTLWISALSYLSSWMMAIVGYTYRVTDTVFGVSLLAAGTSLPEAVSSVILARRGLGTMGVSNGVGSNTFNILICLGLPWLLRGLVDGVGYARVASFALGYSTGLCGVSIVLIHFLLAVNKFTIDFKIACVSFLLYAGFLILDSLIQLNVLAKVSLPICD